MNLTQLRKQLVKAAPEESIYDTLEKVNSSSDFTLYILISLSGGCCNQESNHNNFTINYNECKTNEVTIYSTIYKVRPIIRVDL